MTERKTVSSGSPWEAMVGYSRAVRVGTQVFVSGTTGTDRQGKAVAIGDAYSQTVHALKKIQNALESLGAGLGDVTRTRMYVTDITKWEEVGRAHNEFFHKVKPATSMVEVRRLISDDILVEIEADAVVSET
jgi:enamine deaminase RidA (YjgF/YER057c/UK114 family)